MLERIDCGPDPRDPGTPVSTVARLLVWRLQSEGCAFELREDRRSILVRPGERVSAEDRARLTALFHEVRDLLLMERPA